MAQGKKEDLKPRIRNAKLSKDTDVPLKKILLSMLSGVMLTAAFPPGGLDWMAWIAIIPLLISLERERPFSAFRLGMIAGLMHYLTLIYWVLFVTSTYGGIDIFTSSAILLLFSLYLSLYPAVFSLFFRLIDGHRFMVILIACVWVSLEYIRSIFMTGFPWCLLGYSQYARFSLIQISDITGVYGISFLVAAVNAAIYLLVSNGSGAIGKKGLILEVSGAILIFTVCLTYGNFRLSDNSLEKNNKESLTASIIQGNIDQSVKWDPAFLESTMDKYITLTRSALNQAPDLVLWPESAAPFFFQDNTSSTGDIYALAKETAAWMIFGCPAYEQHDLRMIYFNRVCLVSPDGALAGYYDKKHLVPFGEYVPFRRLIPFVNRLVISEGEFSPGRESGLLKMSDISAGALVCYEAIFPDLARRQAKNGAGIFVNLTNDAWFGLTSAPHQHLSMCVFRSVENRRPFIRAANTGFSAFIDPYGRITGKSALFTEEVLKGEVRTDCSGLTFYSKYGDVFVYAILIICLIKFSHELCYHFSKTKKHRLRKK